MVTQVTIAQNSHKFAVLAHHDVAKTFSAHPHFAAARVWSGLTELGSGLIRSATRMLMCRRLCSVRFIKYSSRLFSAAPFEVRYDMPLHKLHASQNFSVLETRQSCPTQHMSETVLALHVLNLPDT